MKKNKILMVLVLLIPLLILWGFMFQISQKGIYFSSERVEEAVRIAIQHDGLITMDQLKTIEELEVRDAGIESLEGLHFLSELKKLDIRDNQITDLSPIEGLTKLTEINLRGNNISDITPLENLKELRVLNARDNLINDISVLSTLPYLEDVNLRNNQITNIDSLANHEYLTLRLYLEGNPIVDYSPVNHYYPSIENKDF